MSFSRADAVSYGQLGRLSYVPGNERWNSQRTQCRRHSVRTVGAPRTWLEPTGRNSSHHSSLVSSRKPGIRSVLRHEPDLGAANDILPALVQVSDVIESAGMSETLASPDHLVIATASRTGSTDSTSETSVLIVVSGPLRESLHLSLLGATGCSLKYDEEEKLVLSRSSPRFDTVWQHPAGCSIQQVACLDGPYRTKGYLAVRTNLGTAVLRLLVQDGQESRLPTSRDSRQRPQVEVHPINISPVPADKGSMQLDVTFNPWNPEELAILDARGVFTVFRIDADGGSGCTKIDSSEPDQSSTEPVVGGTQRHDRGRILWAGNRATVVTCLPNVMTIYSIHPRVRKLSTLGPEYISRENEFLELHRDPNHSNLMYALSSREILCIKLGHDLHSSFDEAATTRPSIELVWRHNRSSEDMSLKLRICPVPGYIGNCPHDELANSSLAHLVIIYSTLSPLVTAYPLFIHNRPTRWLQIADALPIDVPAQLDQMDDGGSQTTALYLSATKAPSKPGNEAETQSSTFFLQTVRLDGCCGLYEGALAVTLGTASLAVKDLRNDTVTKAPIHSPQLRPCKEEISNEDWTAILAHRDGPVSKSIDHQSEWLPSHYLRTRAINWSALLNGLEMPFSNEDIPPLQPQDMLGAILSSLRNPALNPGVHTVLSLCPSLPLTEGVDETQELVQQTFTQLASQSTESFMITGAVDVSRSFTIAALKTHINERVGPLWSTLQDGNGTFDWMSIYEELLKSCMGTLPHSTPSRARIALDKDLRPTAMELVLSQSLTSVAMQSVEPSQPSEDHSMSFWPDSSATDVPEPSLTGSQRSNASRPRDSSQSSRSSRSRQRQTEQPSEIYRTTIEGLLGFAQVTPQGTTTPMLERITGEWVCGENPHDYVWGDARTLHDDALWSQRSSRPPDGRASQPQSTSVSASQPMPETSFPSSQLTQPTVVSNSQPLPGSMPGSSLKKQAQKGVKRRAGFQ